MFVRKAKVQELESSIKELTKSLSDLQNRAFLISIERKGRYNIFTFVRGVKITQIKTMSLMSDDFEGWIKDLIE